MKKFLLFAASALVSASMISCGGDKLAARHSVVLTDTTGTILPFINSFDEPDFAASAKKLMPTAKQIDSMSYLMGINFGYSTSYTFHGLTLERIYKGSDDLKSVGLDAFIEAARTNFTGAAGEELAGKFEVNPGLLNVLASKVVKATEEVSQELRDSLSYLIGLQMGYQVLSNNLDSKRVRSSLEHFLEVDTEHKFLDYINSNFTDSTYAEYAKRFEIAPDKIEQVGGNFFKAKEAARLENIKVQSRLFLKEAAKVPGVKSIEVPYEETVDSTVVEKTASILYHYTKLAEADAPKVELGDSVTVKYLGRHIDYNKFDEGSFDVDGVQYDGKLVKGFTAAILLLREGDEVEVAIPYQLAYGEDGRRSWGGYAIYPCETLVFTLSASNIRKPAAEAAAEAPAAE